MADIARDTAVMRARRRLGCQRTGCKKTPGSSKGPPKIGCRPRSLEDRELRRWERRKWGRRGLKRAEMQTDSAEKDQIAGSVVSEQMAAGTTVARGPALGTEDRSERLRDIGRLVSSTLQDCMDQ